MAGKSKEVILFSRSTGLNDSTEGTGPLWKEDGTTDLRDCLNVTTTPEGKLIKTPGYIQKLVLGNNIDELVASNGKMFIQTSAGLSEFTGLTTSTISTSNVFTVGVKGKYITTPNGLRINVGTDTSYNLPINTLSLNTLGLAAYDGPLTSKVLSKMPGFDSGFVLGSKLYTQKGKFLQYSHGAYNYDSFNLAADFIGSAYTVLQSGQIPGCLITTHAEGITGYFGTGPEDFRKQFFPCRVINGTLYSGSISKLNEYAHVFLSNDGVYALTADGKLTNMTVLNTDHLHLLNDSYKAVYLHNGKYNAVGNLKIIEYDFQNKAVYVHGTGTVTSAAVYKDEVFVGSTVNLQVQSTLENTAVSNTIVKLPYNDFGVPNDKQIRFLYFTGKITGAATFTVRNQLGQSIVKVVNNLGYVQNYKINSLRTCRGRKLSVEIETSSGFFKLEELRASYLTVSSRN